MSRQYCVHSSGRAGHAGSPGAPRAPRPQRGRIAPLHRELALSACRGGGGHSTQTLLEIPTTAEQIIPD